MAWWKSFVGGNEKGFAEIKEDASEEIAGLNVKTAIEAHIKWKNRLKGAIDGSGTEVIDPNTVSRDDLCELGKWLNGEGKRRFGDHPEFGKILAHHTHFHRCAGHTLNLALDGKLIEAEQELNNGDFARVSLNVSLHLMRLWRDVGNK
jgi:hypothetical protein